MKKTITLGKIFALLLFNFIIFYVENPFLLTSIVIVFILVGIPSKYPFIKRLKRIVPIACLIIVFQLIFNYTVPIFTRFELGYLAALRLIAISLSVLLFLTVTSITEMLQVFNFLPKNILLLILMTSYFIPAVLTEEEKIKSVQKSRGMNLNSINIINNLASVIIPLLHRIFQRAEVLSITILARGYEE